MSSRRWAVAGNPNVGKTSLFNRLTGARHRVGNHPGVTVETRLGRLQPAGDVDVELVDLPGTYVLTPDSEDERIAYRVVAGRAPECKVDGVLVVVDATNLARNLYFLHQLLELSVPCVVALNMIDAAEQSGLEVDACALARALGCPVVATSAESGRGLEALTRLLAGTQLSAEVESYVGGWRADAPKIRGGLDVEVCLEALATAPGPEKSIDSARGRWLISAAVAGRALEHDSTPAERDALAQLTPEQLQAAARALTIARYVEVDRVVEDLGLVAKVDQGPSFTERLMARSEIIDKVVTHSVAGPLLFCLVMATLFEAMFTWAGPLVDGIGDGMAWLGSGAAAALGEGTLADLVNEGLIAGVGNVLVFVPQIALLFLFLGILEDSGYMARAAFLIDRIMRRAGLSGRSFVPLLSGYGCAIPALMSTRTIPRFRDRLVTMLMVPFMSCSARLPVYALIIAAFFDADRPVWGPFQLGALILLGMYLLSTLTALLVGALYRKVLLPGPTPPFVLEMPPYRWPRPVTVLRHAFDQTMAFIKGAGSIILALTIVLWAALSFPRVDPLTLPAGETAIEHSVAGTLGKALEPVWTPMGQDWRMGIGIIGSFAAREVMVSTLGLVYGIEGVDEDEGPLRDKLSSAVDPATGQPRHTALSGLALMVFFAFAAQCMSTQAALKRETGGWRWPLFSFVSMSAIAYSAALLVFQVGRAMGLG